MRLLADSVNSISSELSRAAALPSSASKLPAAPSSARAEPPALYDELCDHVIPSRVYAAWIPVGKPRPLMRALTRLERAQLNQRLFGLQCGLARYAADDVDLLEALLSAFFNGFRNQAKLSPDAVRFTIINLRRDMEEFPYWAIEEAIKRIKEGRTGLDPHWLPNDGEITAVVREVVRSYLLRVKAIEALLEAPVEAPTAVERPTPDEIKAQLADLAERRRKTAEEDLMKRNGLTKEQWDALPDAKPQRMSDDDLVERYWS